MRPFPPGKSYFFPLLLRKISVVYSAWATCGDPVAWSGCHPFLSEKGFTIHLKLSYKITQSVQEVCQAHD